MHSLGGAPGQRGAQQTQSASLCQRPPWAGSAGPWSSIRGEEHAGKSPDPLQLWSQSSRLTNWRYLRNNATLPGQLLTISHATNWLLNTRVHKNFTEFKLNYKCVEITILKKICYSPMYATLSVTMYLLWLTLEYGISEWFPTGTMYNFWKENERKFSGEDTDAADAVISRYLTIWMLILWWGLSIEAKDWRKGSMAGSESSPQLISIRILTFLSNAAALMASSINGQNLFNYRSQSEEIKQKRRNGLTETNGFFCGSGSPARLFKASGGEVLHDGYIDIVLGLWDDGENSL